VTRLSERARASLPASVEQPAYDRTTLRRGIVHLGLGAFHRAHQALYTEAAMASGDTRWGIVGVSMRSKSVPGALIPQDLLYSVLEREDEDAHARLVGALHGALHAPTQLGEVLDALADPQTHLVTSTVTEKGYSVHSATGELDVDDEGIRHDLAHPEAPASTIGLLFAGLRRRARGAPLTVLCCDNMASNGETLRKLVLQFANLVDADVAQHIERTIAFPSSMVDRIVPAATSESLDWAAQRLGVRDEAAIVCEAFSQWVIEDRFAGPRPAWERAGALLVNDVRPYQAMKLRLLNGTHSAIAYLGQLRDLETVSDAMRDPLIGPFVRRLMTEDLRSTVAAPGGYDVLAYCDQLLRRFENPSLAHRTQQIAMDGTQKVPVRWLPALRDSLDAGMELPLVERALAAWLHYLLTQRSDSGTVLAISDPGAAALGARMRAAQDTREAARAALAHTSVFGERPWPVTFLSRLSEHLAVLHNHGVGGLLSDASTAARVARQQRR
jgi:fructuronate reductase